MEKVFLLKWDFSHLGDVERDAFLVPFEGSNVMGSKLMGTKNVDLPEKIFFEADFTVIPGIDFPIVDLSINVMSRRMLSVLLSVGKINYRAVPAVMVDYTYLGERFESPGKLKKDVPVNQDYAVIQLMEFTDAFDYDLSDYKQDEVFPEKVGQINKLVLKEPEGGFPPVFKLAECRRYLFITEKAKDALLSNEIQGCVFEGLDRVR